MLKRRLGRNDRVGITLLAAVACTVLLQQPGRVSGQTVLVIDRGKVTASDGSVTIDWIPPIGEEGKLKATVFYGSKDGRENEADWQKRAEFPKKGQTEKTWQVVIDGLKPETAYVYRIRATGPEGASWSGSATFETTARAMPWYGRLGIVVGVIALFVVPFTIGGRLAKRFRMPDHGWKIGLILFLLAFGLVVIYLRWKPRLGIDLSGGTILVYEVDQQQKDPNKPVDMDKLVGAVSERVNPGGQKEMTIRQYGAEQIEVAIPNIDPEEAERIKRSLTKMGTLEFRILASRRDKRHAPLLKRAATVDTTVVRDAKGNQLGRWVPVQPGQEENFEDYLYGTDPKGNRTLLAESEREVAIRETVRRGERGLEVLVRKDSLDVDGRYLTDARPSSDEYGDPCVRFQFNSTGGRLFGQLTSQNLPDREFYRKLGIILDGRLYSAPRINSTIYDQGVIEGKFTNEEVADQVRVLNAGSLPAALTKEPIFELTSGPTLGWDTIVKGCWAIGTSLVLVLVFMLFYYRFAGVIACAALLMNLVMILAIMMLVRAAFTLPGLAGLVLTVGMAVDANVLIFERIREELGRGAALRMAIRNGFGRATTTIVDANVTTLITGVILFVIGTDVVRGFATVLILGVVLSMYTAIFCSRVVFDIAERRRWITQLTMMRILGATQIDFIGKRRVFAAISAAVILIGLVCVAWRSTGRAVGLFDIDFTGGVSVQVLFTEPQEDIADVRKALDGLPDLAVSDVQLENEPRLKRFMVNTSKSAKKEEKRKAVIDLLRQKLEEVDGEKPDSEARTSAVAAVQRQVNEVFELKSGKYESAIERIQRQVKGVFDERDNQRRESEIKAVEDQLEDSLPSAIELVEQHLKGVFPDKLATNSVTVDEIGPAGRGTVKASANAEKASAKKPAGPEPAARTRNDLPQDPLIALVGSAPLLLAQVNASDQEPTAGHEVEHETSSDASAREAPDESTEDGADPPAEEPADEAAVKSAADPFAGGTQARLTFTREVGHETVREIFVKEFGAEDQLPALELTPLMESANPEDPPRPDADFTVGDSTPYKMWNVKIKLPPGEAKKRLASIKATAADTPFFPSSNTIGGKVAGSTRMLAIYALAASLLAIVAYLWIRFQRVVFGLAAVVALVHDVLVTLGAIALSAFLAPYLGILLIDQFKIGLPVLAAFLTIIGYSLNDTIVVFDRIREVRGKAPRLTQEMVNSSINQTLARTLLTSLTTLIVVLILYMFGGQNIHTFAFALVVGVAVGTYSSVFVASPALLWMTQASKAKRIA